MEKTEEMVEEKKGVEGEVPFRMLSSSKGRKKPTVDMNQVVGTRDILFICLDTPL